MAAAKGRTSASRWKRAAGEIEVYTTRPDTLFGATYMVLAPEHPLVAQITTAAQKSAVEDYIAAAAMKSDLERTELAKDKTGVFTGAYAVNPVNGKKIPVWISDYILISYGTGAIMAVPGARRAGLRVREEVRPSHRPGGLQGRHHVSPGGRGAHGRDCGQLG